jgi:hypothetical protein
MKQKILFYGNCQTGVLGEWLHNNYSDKFQVVDCKECGLVEFWSFKNFAIWSLENAPNQKDFYKCVKDKIEKCDIFVFTHIENRAIEELQTKNLCSTVASNKLKICVPNLRFSAYPICIGSLHPFIKYVYQNVSKNEKEIFDYLLNENDPKFEEIVNQQYRECMSKNIARFKTDLNKYGNAINVNDFISNNWKKHLLFGTLAHPIGVYWEYFLEEMVKMLDIPFEVEKTKDVRYPNKDGIHDPRLFSFFNSIFPNIIIPSEIGSFYDTRIDIIKQPLEKHYA